jgi:hypothetical protein
MRVAHLAWTPEIARAVVQRVSDVPEQLDLAREVIARTGSAGRKLLATMQLDKKLSKTRDALLAPS